MAQGVKVLVVLVPQDPKWKRRTDFCKFSFPFAQWHMSEHSPAHLLPF